MKPVSSENGAKTRSRKQTDATVNTSEAESAAIPWLALAERSHILSFMVPDSTLSVFIGLKSMNVVFYSILLV